ncbi:hypothetical protein B0H10DRAFT_2063774 [Mycena sp. CBHHK59/15]|nr:hypothetical protein B0H10DRAFT_2063774 [Mycena sp. CBHHK59/15]
MSFPLDPQIKEEVRARIHATRMSKVVRKGFPDAWMTPQAQNAEVIHITLWNFEAPHQKNDFNVHWEVEWFTWGGWPRLLIRESKSRSLFGILLREYFGLQGCVIPVAAFLGDSLQSWLVFTLAGPETEKEFYLVLYGEVLDGCTLSKFNKSFPSIDDFFRNGGSCKFENLRPLSDGSIRMQNLYEKGDTNLRGMEGCSFAG